MPDGKYENMSDHPVCGIDEVGRAPLAGPVTAACVVIPLELYTHPVISLLKDSKALTKNKREYIFSILAPMVQWALGWVSHKEIDKINIHNASLLAMQRAHDALVEKAIFPKTALVDGKFAPQLDCKIRTIIKGDVHSISISAASIIAKVSRDNYMNDLAQQYPHYGWHKNAGYSTRIHIDGIKKHGPCPYHRMSFGCLKKIAV